MPKATEYCVALDNKPGTLAKLTASLAKVKVNVTAISTSENTQCNWIRLVAGPGPKVKKVLAGGKYHYCSQPVLTVAVRDEPGQLARVSERQALLHRKYTLELARAYREVSGYVVSGEADTIRNPLPRAACS